MGKTLAKYIVSLLTISHYDDDGEQEEREEDCQPFNNYYQLFARTEQIKKVL